MFHYFLWIILFVRLILFSQLLGFLLFSILGPELMLWILEFFLLPKLFLIPLIILLFLCCDPLILNLLLYHTLLSLLQWFNISLLILTLFHADTLIVVNFCQDVSQVVLLNNGQGFLLFLRRGIHGWLIVEAKVESIVVAIIRRVSFLSLVSHAFLMLLILFSFLIDHDLDINVLIVVVIGCLVSH